MNRVSRLLFSGLTIGIAAGAANAQEYPVKPVRIIVPYTAGGGSDLLGRLAAKKLGEAFGQQVIVENRSGAGGIVGQMNVRDSAPDGYSLLMTTIGFGANPALYRFRKLPFDPTTDFTPIVKLVDVPTALVVNGTRPTPTLGTVMLPGSVSACAKAHAQSSTRSAEHDHEPT